MKIIEKNKISNSEYHKLLTRYSINIQDSLDVVKPILEEIKINGKQSVIKYAKKFDGFRGNEIRVSEHEFNEAEKLVDDKIKNAITTAASNVEKFHLKQKPVNYNLETMPGIFCSREYKAIENVGLYIPGGTTVLPSTMLMLGIPAKIAGCKRVVACSPSKNENINPVVLYAAKICGINEIYKIGGAQAIGLLSYGTEEIPKVDKIFGPGNQFVTAAKSYVSIDPDGCAIDMPAGPSEVLIIADEFANPAFISSDILSQAEHGNDSQAILVTTSSKLSEQVIIELNSQLSNLDRKYFAENSLKSSFILLVDNYDEAVEFSNRYAPEHLIINCNDAEKLKSKVINAGSVFLGPYSPESVGDYASGTNHSLPTYGYAKSFSGVNVEMFMKGITFQRVTEEGLNSIADTVITLAEAESLQAHAEAVRIRIKK